MTPQASLLGPKGTPLVEFGGERSYKTFRNGDVIASLQWIDVKASDPQFEEDGPVPCMCLYHAHRRAVGGAYVIPQVNAFAYAKNDGDGIPDSFLLAVYNAVEELGFDKNDKAARHRIFTIVLDAMSDLINMPSDQPRALDMKRFNRGIEVTVRDATGKAIHQELQ